MFEVRFHARAGQGAKSASQLLAEASIELGKYIQAYPEYGPERRGAPTKAFTRISDEVIKTHEPVTHPDAVVVIDPTLISVVPVEEGVTKGFILVNTPKDPEEIAKIWNNKYKVHTIDATKIAMELLGKDIPNTAMLGALLKIKEVVKVDALKEKVKDMFLEKLGEKLTSANLEVIDRAYKEVK